MLVVSDWIAGVLTSDIEEAYSANTFVPIRHGDIRGFADGSRFLLESVLRIAAIVLGRAYDSDEIRALLKRIDLGIPREAFGLTELPIVLTRGEILALWRQGLKNRDELSRATKAQIEELLGTRGSTLFASLHEELAAIAS